MSEAVPALRFKGVSRRFRQGGEELTVLEGVDCAVYEGEIAALVGPSGSGKSTLLHLAGLLDRPSEGEVFIEGEPTGRLPDRRRTALRGKRIGFVYQFHHLQPEFSALENTMLPLLIQGVPRRQAAAEATKLLEAVGLSHRLDHRPARLSGGEQQRVAIARALVHRPALLLADEPTGNLDVDTAAKIFDLLLYLVKSQGMAALIATHDPDLARRMSYRITLCEGKAVTEWKEESV